jgi:DNA-binding NtrC family response regulator
MESNLQSVKQRYGIMGRSTALDNALNTAIRVAGTDLTVLITGESGVGKEAISKIIHGLSPRKHNNFIAVNCGAIPEGTINSELFGHEKGSFTGATGERKGYFETVNGGTIFLDEIGEMPLDTQSFLLRILESGEYLRVGSSKVLKTDVRIIAATNVHLEEKIRQGKFREDLFYRLNTVPIRVPPLRERREDIFMLFRKFVVDFAEKYNTPPIQLSDEARIMIEQYNWPGNIRELKNVAEQLSVLSEKRFIDEQDLIAFVPNISRRNLPVLSKGEDTGGFEEREILYKLLFDMKSDLNELKSLVFELINSNDLQIKDIKGVSRFLSSPVTKSESMDYDYSPIREYRESSSFSDKPVILDNSMSQKYEETEVVEENLSLEEMEKDMITKALKKYNSRRKEAAAELGISERTLYRKIKQYNIEE